MIEQCTALQSAVHSIAIELFAAKLSVTPILTAHSATERLNNDKARRIAANIRQTAGAASPNVRPPKRTITLTRCTVRRVSEISVTAAIFLQFAASMVVLHRTSSPSALRHRGILISPPPRLPAFRFWFSKHRPLDCQKKYAKLCCGRAFSL